MKSPVFESNTGLRVLSTQIGSFPFFLARKETEQGRRVETISVNCSLRKAESPATTRSNKFMVSSSRGV